MVLYETNVLFVKLIITIVLFEVKNGLTARDLNNKYLSIYYYKLKSVLCCERIRCETNKCKIPEFVQDVPITA